MAVPEIAGLSLNNPWVIAGVITTLVLIGGVLWLLKKEKILPF